MVDVFRCFKKVLWLYSGRTVASNWPYRGLLVDVPVGSRLVSWPLSGRMSMKWPYIGRIVALWRLVAGHLPASGRKLVNSWLVDG